MSNDTNLTGMISEEITLTPEQAHLAARIAGMLVIAFAQDNAIGAPLDWFSDTDGQAAVGYLFSRGVLAPTVGAQTGVQGFVLNPSLAKRLAKKTLRNDRRFRARH